MADSPEIPHLSEAYAKAHRAYGMVSGILLAWELIGIDFTPTPIENLNITLKSPAAVPYVLVALVLYLAFRFSVEWHHTDVRRRRTRPAKLDYLISHAIGAVAVMIWIVQSAIRAQIFTEDRAFAATFGGLAAVAVALMFFGGLQVFTESALKLRYRVVFVTWAGALLAAAEATFWLGTRPPIGPVELELSNIFYRGMQFGVALGMVVEYYLQPRWETPVLPAHLFWRWRKSSVDRAAKAARPHTSEE